MNLSARALWLAGAVFALGILGQWSGDEWRALWRFPAALLILALLLEGWRARRLTLPVQRRAAPYATLGRLFNGEWVLGNPYPRRLRAELETPLPEALDGPRTLLRFDVAAGAEQSQSFSAIPQRLGACTWPPVYARVLGDLGLAWWPQGLLPGGQLDVRPDYLHAGERGVGIRQLGELKQRHAGGGGELLLLRDYRPGDAPRLIDWKASARSGRYTVRVFSEERRVELLIAIDAGRTSTLRAGALTRLGHYANCAARLAELALRNGDRVGLVVFADAVLESLPPLKGRAGLLRLRAVLERLHSRARESNPLPAVLHAQRLARQRSLVVMFTDLGESDAAGQLAKATAQLTPKHLPLIATLREPDIAALATQAARAWLDPYISYAAGESLHDAERAVRHLERLGAAVVQADPPHLDRAVLSYYEESRRRKRV